MGIFVEKIIKNIKKDKIKYQILFTEGWNKTIQQAAIDLKQENIIEPILLLKSKSNNKKIEDIKQIIIDQKDLTKYSNRLFNLRKEKGLTLEQSSVFVKEPNYLSAVLLEMKEVDGVVCGIEYTTRDTLRAALQVVKQHKKSDIVSTAMFLERKNDVLVFGDCSLNLNPNAKHLASIASDIANISLKLLELKKINVALLSYSTNGSGAGESVDKVREASKILNKKKNKDIDFFGEIQFDAAIVPEIRKKKISDLKWNKNADVFIFPNLESANIGYKIAERLADDITAIGPVVIGLKRPMNDLSRGSTLESVKSIAYITAAQAKECK